MFFAGLTRDYQLPCVVVNDGHGMVVAHEPQVVGREVALGKQLLHRCMRDKLKVLPCVAVCCRVLPCVAVCCSVLQCVKVCCSALLCVVDR